jgi:hypothetical protein
VDEGDPRERAALVAFRRCDSGRLAVSMRRWLLVLTTIVVCAIGSHVMRGRALDRRLGAPAELDVLYVPPIDSLRWMSMGYREALADLLWVRALIYTGENLKDPEVAAVDRYVEAVNGLAPRFRRAYLWGGITAVYGGQTVVTRDMVDRAIAIYRRGLEQFPESHELLYPFGMLLLNQVPSTAGYDKGEIEALRAEGIEAIRRAAAFGADPLVRQYAATLVAEHGADELAIQFLETQLSQAQDEDHRRMLRRKLEQRGGADSARRIERLRESFEAERTARVPYVPEALWAVLREDRIAPP